MLGHYWVYLVLAAAVAFQAYVTFRVWRTDAFDRAQKRAQSKLVWLVPVLGASIVISAIVEEESFLSGKQNDTEHR